VATVIKKSSNIGAAKIGLMLGNKRMEAYLRGFGFGRKPSLRARRDEGR
jgi:cell division protein FtsI (penicillin-binding protein 3)